MASRLSQLLLLLLFVPALYSHAQVRAAAAQPLTLAAYGNASGALREQGYGKSIGYSGGLILAHSNWLALDGRGVILNQHIPLHTYIVEAGPRVARRYGRLLAYGEAMGGYAHSGYRPRPRNHLRTGFGIAFSAAAGVDLRLTRRFDWRVADVAWNHITAGPGVSPVILSSGVVFHLF